MRQNNKPRLRLVWPFLEPRIDSITSSEVQEKTLLLLRRLKARRQSKEPAWLASLRSPLAFVRTRRTPYIKLSRRYEGEKPVRPGRLADWYLEEYDPFYIGEQITRKRDRQGDGRARKAYINSVVIVNRLKPKRHFRPGEPLF